VARGDDRAEIQHYVPLLLLRGFLIDPQGKEQVFVYDKHEDRSFHTNIKNIAAEREFYNFDVDGIQGDVESILSELEGKTKSAFEKLIESESIAALDGEQRAWLSVFLATQQLRTRHFREVIKAFNVEVAEHIRKQGYDPKETKGFELIETEDDLKKASLEQLAISIGPHSTLINTKVCFLTTTCAERPFWISDHPVVMHNSREFGPYGNIGLEVPGIQIYLPLTSTLLLALWCETNADTHYENVELAKREIKNLSIMRALGRDVDKLEIQRQIDNLKNAVDEGEPLIEALMKGSIVQATAENVTFYNHLQVLWSHRYLISPNNDFALAKKMISEKPKYREGFMPKFG